MKKGKFLIAIPLVCFSLLFFTNTIVDAEGTASYGYVDQNLQNGMTPSADFSTDMTVDQYLAQYSYPHLPKEGVTSSYTSTEVDITSIDKSKIALVWNQTQFRAAVSNANIQVISLMASFAVTSLPDNGTSNRKLVIEGNNMLIDFRNTLSNLTGANTDVTIQNLNAYHGNYYGFIRPTAATSILKFHNLNDYGSQIISSQSLPVQISGDFQNRFTNYNGNTASNLVYKSPIDGTTNVTALTVDQQNFESSNLEFFADSNVVLQTGNGVNVDLTGAGDIVFYENAKVDIIGANSSAGSGEGYQGYAISTRGYKNNFIMNKNSEINYTYTNPGNGMRDYAGLLWFQSAGSTFSMKDGAKLSVNKDSHSGNNGIIHFNGNGSFSMTGNSKIDMNIKDTNNGASAISLQSTGANFTVDSGSKITTNFTSTGAGNNSILNLGGGTSLTLGKDSGIDITASGYNNNILTMGSGSSASPTNFIVGENANFNINSTNRNSWTTDVVSVGNYANFNINRLGTFKLSADQARYLFNIGTNSKFQFSDAQLVEFGYTKTQTTSSALINMTGNFLVDVQRVKAWNRSSSALDDTKPDYDWNPMFSMTIPYTGTAVNKTTLQGASTTPGTAESFKSNYNTGTVNGFQKLRFEFIPDVTITIDNQPVDNPSSADSKTISGTASAGAYIRLSDTVVKGGYSSFPASNNTVANPSVNLDGTKGDAYTVIADDTGHFEYTVPTESNIPFVAGNTIQAYAFKDGKSATTNAVVKDTTPPVAEITDLYLMAGSAVPDVNKFILKLTDSNPAGNPTASYVTPSDTMSGYMNTIGVYDIDINVQDQAGNTQQYTTKLHIVDRTSDILGNDVTLTTTDIANLTDTEFQALVKSKVNGSAYKITDGIYKDLTDKITYDFTTVPKKSGSYELTFKVSAADSGVSGGLSKTVSVIIGNLGPTPPVDPDNPKEGTTPPNGAENSGTNATGALRMDYAPSKIDFGTVTYNPGTTVYNAKNNQNTSGENLSKQWIQISDDRNDENGWSVKVLQETAFKDNANNELKGATLTIPNGELRNSLVDGVIATSGTDAKMASSSVEISAGVSGTMFSAKNLEQNSLGKSITTYQWDPTKVTLKVPKGTAKPDASYSTTINWSLVSAPEQ